MSGGSSCQTTVVSVVHHVYPYGSPPPALCLALPSHYSQLYQRSISMLWILSANLRLPQAGATAEGGTNGLDHGVSVAGLVGCDFRLGASLVDCEG